MTDPRNIHAYAHAHLVEQIMALIGRASSDPAGYRRTLESFESSTLRRTLAELTGDGAQSIGSARSDAPRSEEFPAPSLTESAGVIASADTGRAPGSAREVFNHG